MLAAGREAMNLDDRPPGFGVGARFEGDQAVLDVRGEVDVLSVPTLAVLFDCLLYTSRCV